MASRAFLYVASALGITGAGYQLLNSTTQSGDKEKRIIFRTKEQKKQDHKRDREEIDSNFYQNLTHYEIPTREQQIEKLKNPNNNFDILVVGGGATGAGVALDAACRGLSVAMVERDDFSAGASSKSTKLIHGGVRYLEKAVFNLDPVQFKLVIESLNERSIFLDIAPHLTSQLPFMIPIYKKWQVPYYWLGSKCYDLLAGTRGLSSSFYLSKKKALERFPMLKDGLVGAMVYYDGQQDDSRMNLSLALTAAWKGAVVANHTEVVGLIKDENGVICGARLKDHLSHDEWDVKAKTVVSATGPFTDDVRRMDDPGCKELVVPSSGVHIVLPDYYSPNGMGMLDPATSDGRVLFFVPWKGRVIAGTTDSPTKITHEPIPSEDDICFILDEIKNYLSSSINVRRGDVLSAWSGIRPLVKDPSESTTQAIARTHVISVHPKSKLIFVTGGKWTIYRAMAKDTVDKAIEIGKLDPKSPDIGTESVKIIGSYNWTPTMFIRLVQDYGFDKEVAVHLSSTYGDRSFEIAKEAIITGKRWPVVGKRLCSEFPYIEDEVRFAIKEYARTTVDVIARRLRLSFLSISATEEALPRIIDILAEELNWQEDRKKKEYFDAQRFLLSMGKKPVHIDQLSQRILLTDKEKEAFTKEFEKIDFDHDGHISVTDLKRVISNLGFSMSDHELSSLIKEVDADQSGGIGLHEFLTFMSSVSTGEQIPNRLSAIAKHVRKKIDVERSSGGL